MDQFCSDVAESSDTKKRCICSARWETIHSRRDDLSTARGLIQQFTDNNITAVGMSAEEVAAQYAATAGEMAIGERSSASAALDQISDLLSGTGDTANRNQPVGLININDMFSAFDFDGGGDTVGQTGQQLFDTASRQCLNLVSDVCPSDSAATTMVRNAYSVMIDNACTVMERDNDTEKEKVLSAVRELNKALMSERLKEYRSHNSASVNQCIDRVKMEIQSDSACGENYMRCLDFTGLYINATTGEPIYTPRLFQLANQIKLEDMSSRETQQFMAGLETYKNRVTATLDTCRDDAELVWNEFKTQALIEIAQAQDEKLEEIKGSCISTMKTCYDTQTGAMRDFDDTSAQASGALAARASRAMCQNQVAACANLYADPNNSNCAAPDSANLSNTTGSNVCGLQALLNFVNTVDDIRIQEGCAESLQNHADDLCKPGIGDTNEWPYGCRKLTPDALKSNLVNYAKLYCSENQADIPEDSWIIETINDKVDEIYEVLDAQMSQICRGLDGAWIYRPDPLIPWVQSSINPGPPANNAWNTRFVSTVFGNAAPYEPGESWGACVENSAAIRCKLADDKTPEIDGDASWDSTLQECNYELTWYQAMCENYLGGTWDGGTGTCGYI
jgi:hypothetical protein